ncbi:MAG: carboxypeptidase regulatory-like domain-containing protein, partial [Bacteroidales bacterium]|nr:carboxypeptidase regulatory-like domain-containing protein [Bacteroidales bacterium]
MKNLWIAGLFFALSVQAQDVYLYGKITDTTGNPVEGVEVRLFNAELVDTTDAEGNYSFGSEPIEKPEYLDGIAQK